MEVAVVTQPTIIPLSSGYKGETDAGASKTNQAVHILYMGVNGPLLDMISMKITSFYHGK